MVGLYDFKQFGIVCHNDCQTHLNSWHDNLTTNLQILIIFVTRIIESEAVALYNIVVLLSPAIVTLNVHISTMHQ